MSSETKDAMTKSIILGEASESDVEDELPSKKIGMNWSVTENSPTNAGKIVYGAVISGEASESDEDESISSAVSAGHITHFKPPRKVSNSQKDTVVYESLLQKKFLDDNVTLRKDIYSLVTASTQSACKDLTATEQQLIKSQVTLQTAITALQTLHKSGIQLQRKLHNVISGNFLPNISHPR